MSDTPPVELLRVLAALAEPPVAEHAALARAVALPGVPEPAGHTGTFALQLHPYASVHLGPEGMLGGEARDRVAGFWAAVGQAPPDEPDHLSALLALYATLAERETGLAGAEARLARRAREALLHEHLAPWVPFFLERVQESGAPFYAPWAELLERVLEGELAAAPPPATPPLHLREAPALPDPRVAGAAPFLAGMFAPVRAGIILTRADLARIGRGLGIGVRMGERRWVLEQLLGQEPARVLETLAGEARARAGRHAARVAVLGPSADFWASRAHATARLLLELSSEEARAEPTGIDVGGGGSS